MAENDALQDLRSHPVSAIIEPLSRYTGIGRSLITLTEYLSLSAGKMVMPVNIDLVTDQEGLDLQVVDRLLRIDRSCVARIDTHRQFYALEKDGFENLAVILIRRFHSHLYRNVVGCMARSPDPEEFLPSVWRIVSQDTDPFLMAPTLRLFTKQVPRKLQDFAHAYAVAAGPTQDCEYLSGLLNTLARTCYPCYFRQHYSMESNATTGEDAPTIGPLPLLVLERMLQVFANLRRLIDRRSERAITIPDYRAVRALLLSLPLAPVDRTVSAHAIDTAKKIFDAVHSGNHQLSLPDRSGEGHGWFTRVHAMKWAECAYNTVNKHLQELENDGIVISTKAQNNRDHGVKIHFRFADGHVPPFRWKNVFEGLPDITNV